MEKPSTFLQDGGCSSELCRFRPDEFLPLRIGARAQELSQRSQQTHSLSGEVREETNVRQEGGLRPVIGPVQTMDSLILKANNGPFPKWITENIDNLIRGFCSPKLIPIRIKPIKRLLDG